MQLLTSLFISFIVASVSDAFIIRYFEKEFKPFFCKADMNAKKEFIKCFLSDEMKEVHECYKPSLEGDYEKKITEYCEPGFTFAAEIKECKKKWIKKILATELDLGLFDSRMKMRRKITECNKHIGHINMIDKFQVKFCESDDGKKKLWTECFITMAKNDSLKPYNEGLKCFQDNMKEDEYMALTKEYCTKNDFQYPEKIKTCVVEVDKKMRADATLIAIASKEEAELSEDQKKKKEELKAIRKDVIIASKKCHNHIGFDFGSLT